MNEDLRLPPSREPLRKVLLSCGILSSLLYVALLCIIPRYYEGYSIVNQTISELSAIGAPTRPLWVPPSILYTLFLAAFGWGIRLSADGNRPLFISGTTLFAYGIIGLGWVIAPMHRREILAAGGATFSDTMHLVMSGISSLFMMVSMGFSAAALGKGFRLYTIVTMATLFVFGLVTGMMAPDVSLNLPTPWLGVWEIIMLGVFLLWVVVLAMILLRHKTKASPFQIITT